MKRILHFLDSLEISGGVQSVVMNIYRTVDHSRCQFDFAVYDCPQADSYRQEIESLGGEVMLIGALSKIGMLEFSCRIRQAIRAKRYDAIHAHNLHHNGIILLLARLEGIPIRISHCHQGMDERNTTFPRLAMVAIFKFLLFYSATNLVACSDRAAAFLYGKRPYTFLPNAINLNAYSKQYDTHKLRHELGICEKTKVILHIGRFSPQKKHTFDLLIMDSLRNISSDYLLLLVGSGELEEDLRRYVCERRLEEAIRFVKLRQDIPALLQMADVAILPSLYEGLPMVALEAQAAGCPMLLSDNVTRQVDLGLGLVEYLPFEEKKWVERIVDLCLRKQEKMAFSIRQRRFMETRFECTSNVLLWYQLYGMKDS